MTKYYEAGFDIPDDLKKHIKKVVSNRRPDQHIVIDAKYFVSLYGEKVLEWIDEDNAMNEKDKQEKKAPKEKMSSTKPTKKTRQDKKLKKEEIVDVLMKYSNMTRPQAEVAAAIEMGEIDGDVIHV